MKNPDYKMLSSKAMNYASKAHKALTNPSPTTNFSAASAYIGCACSYLNYARILYTASHNSAEETAMTHFFDQFDVFVNETLTTIDTGSRSQIDEEYTDLCSAYGFTGLPIQIQ